jgi:hypothetical protein
VTVAGAGQTRVGMETQNTAAQHALGAVVGLWSQNKRSFKRMTRSGAEPAFTVYVSTGTFSNFAGFSIMAGVSTSFEAVVLRSLICFPRFTTTIADDR